MNIPVMIASRKALSQRETPSSVTIITGAEIRDSGARNLIDVLRQVPSLDFRTTVSNGLAAGMRGQIGSNGRILMLVDGITVNEHRYGSAVFGQGFPVAQIARIEVIRGSALALYGGTALLGVINIISKNAAALNGASIGTGIGSTTNGINSRKYVDFMISNGGNGPVKLTAMAHVAQALRSNRFYQDITGGRFNMSKANATRLGYLNLGLQTGDFSARYLHEESKINDRDGAYTIRPAGYKNFYLSDSLLLQQRYQANNQLTLTPSVLYQTQSPRKTIRANGTLYSATSLKHIKIKLPATWDLNAHWHLAGGLEYMREDYQSVVRPAPLKALPFNRTSISSLYTEALWRNTWGDITGSARLDQHSHAGALWAERLDYTKIMGAWHFKLMGSYAERAPSMESYASLPSTIRPENARTWGIETGYRVNSDTQLTLNLFDITTFDTLILTNMQKVHTRGLEANYKTQKKWGYADLSYSYYSAAGTNTPALQPVNNISNQVIDHSMNLAFPAQKLTAKLHYHLLSDLSINPSLVYLGPRWGYIAPDPTYSGGTLHRFSATPLLNVVLRWNKTKTSGLDLTLGLYNTLNKNINFISPMNAYHAPLPGMGREVMLQIQYKL